MVKLLDLQAITMQHYDEYKVAAERVIESGWFLQGKENGKFEEHYAQYIGSENCVAVANGLDALYLIMRAYKEMGELKDNDEVRVQIKPIVYDKECKVKFVGYEENVFYDFSETPEKVFDEPITSEEIEIQ